MSKEIGPSREIAEISITSIAAAVAERAVAGSAEYSRDVWVDTDRVGIMHKDASTLGVFFKVVVFAVQNERDGMVWVDGVDMLARLGGVL